MKKDYRKINQAIGNYIAGFTDGEGRFNVSIKKRNDYKNTWKLTASCNISQNERHILGLIKKTIGCGTLRERKDGVVYYEVTNITSLYENVLPFFERFSFLSQKKKKNFAIFRQIVRKMYNKEHFSKEGMREILELREKLNAGIGRKRKYTLQDVITEK